MFDYTKRAKKIIDLFCQTEGRRLNSEILIPEHILLALLKERDSAAIKILAKLGINFDILKRTLDNNFHNNGTSIVIGSIPHSKRFNKILEYASDECRKLNNNFIGTEHLLLALFRYQKITGIEDLIHSGINYGVIREEIKHFTPQSNSRNTFKKNRAKNNSLEEFSYNLTKLAEEKKLDPVIGRNKEILRVIHILCRKTKNNPVLIGEAGVGKTAVAEGLAQRIVEDNLPEPLKNKTILSLDMPGIVAGTKYRGEFEDRLKNILTELKGKPDTVIFIDEIHTIMGAGAAEGAIDAANILKPFLARGEIQCIGATTLSEYRKYIEKDAALERRFQTIQVNEPSIEETEEILFGLRPAYEKHHLVKFTDESIEYAAKYSSRYISERYLPDKAIDILDEAGARARLNNTERPEEINQLENEIEVLDTQKKDYVENQEYEKAAEIRDLINSKKSLLSNKNDQWTKREGDYLIKVTSEDVLSIISSWTGIPLDRLEENESSRLLNLEEKIHQSLIGQENAVKAISSAIRRSRTGLRNINKPIGSFIFAGPTGVGKTKLAKILAENVFGGKSNLIRIDMSEFMEKHAVSRLIGSPPGYVGFEQGGQLTEKIRRNPYSVILFDEIEKAHNDFFNILLQIMEEGELTDNSNRIISFRNTIIIMTSNLGNSRFDKSFNLGFSDSNNTSSLKEEKVIDSVKNNFNPEFINRVDDIIYFHSLTYNDIQKITEIELEELKTRAAENNFHLKFTKQLINTISDLGYNEKYGARFIQRIIRENIEDILAVRILSGDLQKGNISISANKNGVTFRQTKIDKHVKLNKDKTEIK